MTNAEAFAWEVTALSRVHRNDWTPVPKELCDLLRTLPVPDAKMMRRLERDEVEAS